MNFNFFLPLMLYHGLKPTCHLTIYRRLLIVFGKVTSLELSLNRRGFVNQLTDLLDRSRDKNLGEKKTQKNACMQVQTLHKTGAVNPVFLHKQSLMHAT